MTDPNKTAAVEMTRAEAERLSQVLNDLRISRTELVRAYERKRSWRPVERAMAIAKVSDQLTILTQFHEALKSAHHIGGY